jgi:hypothetical protein
VTNSELRIGLKSFVLVQVVISIQGQKIQQLDTSLKSLPAGVHRLQVGVTQSVASSTSPKWDMAIVYEHSASLSKYRLATEVTTHSGHKASFVDVTNTCTAILFSYNSKWLLVSLPSRCAWT